MKANQNFRNADEAVSPVIGVILMVAITVVLAAVVFVLVSDLGDQGDTPPKISFVKDEAQNTLTVSSIVYDADIPWSELDVNGCTPPTTTNVAAGAQLTSCTGSVTVSHTPTKTLLYTTTFTA